VQLQQAVNDRLRSAVRTVRPQLGGVANARDAVLRDERRAGQRRASSLEQARAEGPRGWEPLHRSPVPARRGAGHAVHFASSDADLVARLSSYVADGLAQGDVCVVIATAEHRAGLHQWLAAHGLQQEQGLLVEHDAEEVLDRLVQDGRLVPEVFHALIASLPQERLRGGSLRAFGEIVSLLHQRGDLGLALELERLWDDVQRRLGFPLLCAYLDDGTSEAAFVGPVCAGHTHLAGRVLSS
jgi:hypothetical protein